MTGGAVLNIQSSEITGQGVVQNVGGIVNITGGTLTASARNTVLSQFGEVHIGASAHLMAAGEGKSAVQLIGAKMTLSGDAVLSGNGGIDVFNSNRNEEGTVSAQVEITGGRIETKDFPVSGNNQESAGAEVAITGGSLKNISGGTAIYWPMEGQLTIGGNAVIEGGPGSKQKWEQLRSRIMRSSQEAANGKKKSRKTVGQILKVQRFLDRRRCTTAASMILLLSLIFSVERLKA